MNASSMPKARGRPRDPSIDQRILDAARMLLIEGGYDSLAVDAISQMTNIPRSMIYRRWPSKVHIANEIATGGDDLFPDVIESDGLYAQVHALVAQVLDRYSRPDIAAAAVGIIAATQGDRSLQEELQAKIEDSARSALRDIVDRGKRSGAVRPDACADILFDTIIGTLIYRVMFSLMPVPDDYAELLTRQIVAGLAA